MTTFHEKEKKWKERNPLRLFRKRHDLRQQNIAVIMKTSYHAIYRLEGGLSEPDEDQYRELAKLTKDQDIRGKWADWLKDRPVFKMDKGGYDDGSNCSRGDGE